MVITQETFVEIHVLAKQGLSYRKIARQLGVSRNTVKKYMLQHTLAEFSKPKPKKTKLEPYHDYIRERIEIAKPDWLPASVLFREIVEQGYDGGIAQLRRYIRPLKSQKIEPLVRFETEPGLQMQIDFTTVRRGKNCLKAFVATLGYSRASFVKFYDNELTESWIDGIKEACEFFGGVPKEILCDNAKALIVSRDCYGEGQHKIGDDFLALSKDYGFKIRTCRPYRAKTKGKVERFNHYLKNNFLLQLKVDLKEVGLEVDVNYANARIGTWLRDTAHQRVHGTTNQTPESMLAEEMNHLLPLPTYLKTIKRSSESITLPYQSVKPKVELSIQHPISVYEQVLTL